MVRNHETPAASDAEMNQPGAAAPEEVGVLPYRILPTM